MLFSWPLRILNTFSSHVQREDCLLILSGQLENSALSQDVGLTSVGGFISADNSSLIFSAFLQIWATLLAAFLRTAVLVTIFPAVPGEFPSSRRQLDYVQI